ncbi:uncharacterized protein PRCAT00006101001 [Priceomyces carsonii]|uniref:uncharacterized protein n=1 Tax=Priceomyces carsonii TaxID=28549 RepID=UPI002ED84462|nr:unnamed protein product [Priceomyces carsonii]
MSSDCDFDDDDDELLLGLVNGLSKGLSNTVVTTQMTDVSVGEKELRNRLYKSDGEVAILRAQLEQLQKQKQEEVENLRIENRSLARNLEEQVGGLRHAMQALEDEKKFLTNELKFRAAVKRRKIDDGGNMAESVNRDGEVNQAGQNDNQQQRVVKLPNDSTSFVDELWHFTIIGAPRSTLTYLSKICVNQDIKVHDLEIMKQTPISNAIVNFLMMKKDHRLDALIDSFCRLLVDLIELLHTKKLVLSIPFLASLIYFSISFRPAAITKSLIEFLLSKISSFASQFLFLLDSNLNQDDFAYYHDVPNQVMVLEKFFLLSCMDIIEKLMSLASFNGMTWGEDIATLLLKCLPENSERFRNAAQINLVSNIVEMLTFSITEDNFAFNGAQIKDETIFNSLLKILLIDLPIREDFMFYGLNRMIGNNKDLTKVDSIIPRDMNLLNKPVILIPEPAPASSKSFSFEETSKHEFHLLNLRIKVIQLLSSYIIMKQSTTQFESKEYMKLMIRTIGFEQNNIMKSPRAKHIHLRIQIISELIRVLNHIVRNVKTVNNLIHPETIYEIFVVLSRISFGSDSLSLEAFKLLAEARKINTTIGFYNPFVEQRARALSHLYGNDANCERLANIEGELANGLEFPYESDIIELSREILNKFVNHEEADNLYFNMNEETNFDEMELVS